MQHWVISLAYRLEYLLNKQRFVRTYLLKWSTVLIFSLSVAKSVLAVSIKQAKPLTPAAISTAEYLRVLQQQNNIHYEKIINTAGSYIPAMCYTRTILRNNQKQNPCYVCHTHGKPPNFINDSYLQTVLDFPAEMQVNPYRNLFTDYKKNVSKISNKEILDYVRQSNYLSNNKPRLKKQLPKDWPGYRPDAYFHFDSEGFDHDINGDYTLWRAYRYYPFPGTFWPANGSTDDVLIRLDSAFSKDIRGIFDIGIYKLNLAIVESLIKQNDIYLENPIDENDFAEDLNKNGQLDQTRVIVFPPENYVGWARLLQQQQKFHLAAGLYPENTEFLHSVRYLDWDEKRQQIKLSARMKELRYAKKYRWFNYAELKTTAENEFWEKQRSSNASVSMETFRGDPSHGLRTNTGWIFQGFIEAKNGELRPQTREETISCMGCHAGIGATTDATFSFTRKLASNNTHSSWLHWSQQYLYGIREPVTRYKNHAQVYEYSFYLKNNPSGSEFSDNDEILKKFWLKNHTLNTKQFNRLHKDISQLLIPSLTRALTLNKGYKIRVDQQNFIFGKSGNISPLKNVFKQVKPAQPTGLLPVISN